MSYQEAKLAMTTSCPAATHTDSSAPKTPAMKAIFDTTELLDSILLQLEEIDDVVHCKAVSRQFRSTILTSPSFRFIPSQPLSDFGSLQRLLDDRKIRQKLPSLNKAADVNACINPLLTSGIQFQRFRPNSSLQRQDWHMSTHGLIYPPGVRIGAILKHDEEFSPSTRLDTDSIAVQELLATRIAHPRLRIPITIKIGKGQFSLSICGEIKSKTTVKEFLEWCDLSPEEMLASKLLVKGYRVN